MNAVNIFLTIEKIVFFDITMSDNKLVKTVMEAATLTGLAAGIGWASKKILKENLTALPQRQRHELRQVHRRHCYQHRAEGLFGETKDSSGFGLKNLWRCHKAFWLSFFCHLKKKKIFYHI